MSNHQENVAGIAEAERQKRVAKRLYEQTAQKKPWSKLSRSAKRPYIDRACQDPYRDEAGYSLPAATLPCNIGLFA
jgi:hypothetical protein